MTVQRRGEEQITKRVWTEGPDETNILEIPKIRWRDQVLRDLGRLGFDLGMAEDRN